MQPVCLGPPLIQGASVQPVSVVHTFEIRMTAAVIQTTTSWPEAMPILVLAAIWVRLHAMHHGASHLAALTYNCMAMGLAHF